jgi:hypothetical protein
MIQVRKGCNLEAEPDLRKVAKRGEISQGIPPLFLVPEIQVSIHAPVRDPTPKASLKGETRSVSIHAPVRGATPLAKLKMAVSFSADGLGLRNAGGSHDKE